MADINFSDMSQEFTKVVNIYKNYTLSRKKRKYLNNLIQFMEGLGALGNIIFTWARKMGRN